MLTLPDLAFVEKALDVPMASARAFVMIALVVLVRLLQVWHLERVGSRGPILEFSHHQHFDRLESGDVGEEQEKTCWAMKRLDQERAESY